MHEVSIMMSVLDTVKDEAQKAGSGKIHKICLEVGEKAGVVVDSLYFAFDMVAANTPAADAKLEIDLIPFTGECLQCGHQFKAEEGFLICDQCGGFGKIISGQELNIRSIEIET